MGDTFLSIHIYRTHVTSPISLFSPLLLILLTILFHAFPLLLFLITPSFLPFPLNTPSSSSLSLLPLPYHTPFPPPSIPHTIYTLFPSSFCPAHKLVSGYN